MNPIANLVQQRSTSTGTGNMSLSTVLGRQSFNDAFGVSADTDQFYYFITNTNAAEWEVGKGHLSSAAVLVRDTVLNSSNSDDFVNFSAGVKDVINDVPAANQEPLVQIGYRLITAPGDVTVLATDQVIEINKTVADTTIVHCDPTILGVGRKVTIKLSKDDGITNEVTVTPTTGDFDGAGTYVMQYPRQAITFYSNGTNLRGVA